MRVREGRILALGVLLVIAAVVTAGMVRMRAYNTERRAQMNSCEMQLRLIHVISHHVPDGLSGLPPEKAISYSFCGGCEHWTPTQEERKYLTEHHVGQPEDFGWELPGLIYCYEDLGCEEKLAAVANMTMYTPATDLPPSSYLWLPAERPDVLVACPYHHVAILAETGELVPWPAEHD